MNTGGNHVRRILSREYHRFPEFAGVFSKNIGIKDILYSSVTKVR